MSGKTCFPDLPSIEGLTYRRFRGEADYPQMVALMSACNAVDGLERITGVDDLTRHFRHLENCNPFTDMLFAEVNGQVVAFGRIWWEELLDGTRLYCLAGRLHPRSRGTGIGSSMWEAAEQRAGEIASAHPGQTHKYLQVEAFESEKDLVALLEKRSYQAARYGISMLRDLNEPFPEAPIPPGIEVRPVESSHLRQIFDGTNEAFRDHWGSRDQSDEDYKNFVESPIYTPELWKVAWDGDQMVSVVHNFIDHKENVEFHRKRGYTEAICTRRPWRKIGVARSLLVQSMQMFKEMGMTETSLSVDSQNLSGALKLYEGVGYRKEKLQTIYRKPLE